MTDLELGAKVVKRMPICHLQCATPFHGRVMPIFYQ
ncbi:unnamed protein product [Ixodes pacificus]